MALYYTLRNPFGHETEENWYMGNRIPDLDEGEQVVSVQADGDELEVIREHFTGIPMCDSRVVSWQGAFASFIVTNLDKKWRHKGKPHTGFPIQDL